PAAFALAQPPTVPGPGTGSRSPFSRKYQEIRRRLQSDFIFQGQVVAQADGDLRKFSDQTWYMGMALLTLAGEARLCARAGTDAAPSERLLAQLLAAFDRLDQDAERERYHTAVPGFFLR